ncbi:MAG: zinc chelation protein SecC [Methylococcaceae bacterium]|nr:MAG: zinc chelation protein SecC [Methylococcaceae bacterium]
MNPPCPCCSGLAYAECCEPYHSGIGTAPTAAILMRSRYAAYALNLTDYLLKTWHSSSLPASLNMEDGNIWYRLEILHIEDGKENDDNGLVEFKAYWHNKGHLGHLHEISRFIKEDRRWYYLNGAIRPTPATIKIGRNESCFCGSGKKYKHCCSR